MAAQALGIALAALQYGYSALVATQKRSLGPLKGYVVFEEIHSDELEITDHPIEQGAKVSDHAYKRPAELTLKVGWSNSPMDGGLLSGVKGLVNTVGIATGGLASNILGTSSNQVAEIYQQLLKLQESREPFEVFTGKRFYENMLVKSLVVTTDKQSEHILSVTAQLKQVVRVKTTLLVYKQAPIENQKDGKTTASPANSGTKQLVPANGVNKPAASQAISPR